MWRYELSGLSVQSAVDIPFSAPCEVSPDDFDVIIELVSTLERPSDVQQEGQTYISGKSDFLFRPHERLAFRVQPTCIQIERGPNVSDAELLTYLMGSAWGVLSHLRALLPLHCSAVAHGDQIFAFSGRTGAGKSTLAVGLALRGLDHAGDDLLVADVSDELAVNGLPKGVKLDLARAAAFGVQTGSPVGADTGTSKFYTDGPFYQNPGPFSRMQVYVLEVGPMCSIEPLSGTEKFAAIHQNIFRRSWMNILRPKEHIFADCARLAKAVEVFRFTRPRDQDKFSEGIDLLEDHIRSKL